MLYKIDEKYYVRVGKDFTEVELVFENNDVDLKPTQNILEDNGNVFYEEVNFLSEKEKLLEEYNMADNNEKINNKNFKKSSFR